jgi:hypothetical protein
MQGTATSRILIFCFGLVIELIVKNEGHGAYNAQKAHAKCIVCLMSGPKKLLAVATSSNTSGIVASMSA